MLNAMYLTMNWLPYGKVGEVRTTSTNFLSMLLSYLCGSNTIDYIQYIANCIFAMNKELRSQFTTVQFFGSFVTQFASVENTESSLITSGCFNILREIVFNPYAAA